MTNEMLRDAFRGIADRAVPPADGIAERALRQASRRRTTRIAGVAAGTIAAVMAPLLFLHLTNDGRQPPPALKPSVTSSPKVSGIKLPEYTPAQRALAKSCADLPDVRLLATSAAMRKFILVGNAKEHRSCLLDSKGKVSWKFISPRAVENSWDPSKISAPLTLLQALGTTVRANEYERHTAGVVTPAVAKVVLTPVGIKAGSPGYYRQTLHLTNGFFIFGNSANKGNEPNLRFHKFTLTAYDAAGRVLYKITMPYI
jgi:hypothetical protein